MAPGSPAGPSSSRGSARGETTGATLRDWPAAIPAGEAYLATHWRTAGDEPWAPAGFEVAVLQVSIPNEAPAPAAATLDQAATAPVDDDSGAIVHPAPRVVAGPLALARPDRQRPDRRHGPRLGGLRASTVSSAGSSLSGATARRATVVDAVTSEAGIRHRP